MIDRHLVRPNCEKIPRNSNGVECFCLFSSVDPTAHNLLWPVCFWCSLGSIVAQLLPPFSHDSWLTRQKHDIRTQIRTKGGTLCNPLECFCPKFHCTLAPAETVRIDTVRMVDTPCFPSTPHVFRFYDIFVITNGRGHPNRLPCCLAPHASAMVFRRSRFTTRPPPPLRILARGSYMQPPHGAPGVGQLFVGLFMGIAVSAIAAWGFRSKVGGAPVNASRAQVATGAVKV